MEWLDIECMFVMLLMIAGILAYGHYFVHPGLSL